MTRKPQCTSRSAIVIIVIIIITISSHRIIGHKSDGPRRRNKYEYNLLARHSSSRRGRHRRLLQKPKYNDNPDPLSPPPPPPRERTAYNIVPPPLFAVYAREKRPSLDEFQNEFRLFFIIYFFPFRFSPSLVFIYIYALFIRKRGGGRCPFFLRLLRTICIVPPPSLSPARNRTRGRVSRVRPPYIRGVDFTRRDRGVR